MKIIWKRVKPWCIPMGLTLLFYGLFRFVFLVGYVPTASMEPTLPQGSFILGMRIFDEPEVGDIIVFEKDGALLVKRVAAKSGEKVDLSKLPYMTTVPIPIWDDPVITVPDECYFVLGDNRGIAMDSRLSEIGVVTEDRLVGKVFFSIYPFGTVN